MDNDIATRSRSPHKIIDNSELPGRLRQVAALNREGTAKIFTPSELLNVANDYIIFIKNNPIKTNQLITGGAKGGQVVQVEKPRLMQIEELCIRAGVNSAYVRQLKAQITDKEDEISKQYSTVLTYIYDIQRVWNLQQAAAKELDVLIVSRIEGLKDSVEHSGKIEQTITSIIFQSRTIEDIAGEDVTDTAQTYLEDL